MNSRSGAGRFGLVCYQHHRAPFAPKDRRHVVVERVKPGLGVDDHDDHVGCIGGGLGLAASRIGEFEPVRHIGAGIDARRIDETEGSSAPVGECVEAIPGNARRVLDDCEAAAD